LAQLTSRQRVLKTLNHEVPDRGPFAFDCSQQDKMEQLRHAFNVTTDDDLFCAVGSDTRFCMYWDDVCLTNRFDVGETYVDLWGVTRAAKGMYPTSHPLRDAETIDDLDRYVHWPSPDQLDYAAHARRAQKYGDCAVLGGVWSCFMEVADALLGSEEFMVRLLTDPPFIDHLLDRIVGFYMECNRRMFDAMGNRMQVFFMGDDYGTQRDLLYSPDTWRRFVKPRLARLYDLAHDRDYLVMQHSCGSVAKVIPDMIEIGLDVLQPIQVAAAGMDPASLKRDFGDRLAFMGAVDGQRVMAFGTPEQVRQEVCHRIQTLAPGGGFVLSTSQGITPEVPVENIRAMLAALAEFGDYARLGYLN